MIDTNQKKSNSVVYEHSQTGYFLSSDIALQYSLLGDHCWDCYTMSRVAMSCYAAAKHPTEKSGSVACIQPKDKSKTATKRPNKYGEIETSVSLDKYNGKMMFSIWGLYNRNSPHNFKKQNTEALVPPKGQEIPTTELSKFKSTLVHFTVPQFTGIVSVETTLEVTKPNTTLEKFENLFSFPIF